VAQEQKVAARDQFHRAFVPANQFWLFCFCKANFGAAISDARGGAKSEANLDESRARAALIAFCIAVLFPVAFN